MNRHRRILRRLAAPVPVLVAAAALLLVAVPGEAAKKLSVVTTTQDLASIAQMIGGDRVAVETLAKGYQDPHFVDAKPSYLLKLRRADVFVEVGRDLEAGWAPGLLNNSRNSKILPGGPGFVDASNGVKILEQGGRVGREMGDVHPLGNPHYWLDPENGPAIAANIRDALIRNDPAGRTAYEARYADFERRLKSRLDSWKKRAKELHLDGMNVVTYHRSWPYSAKAFGFDVKDYVEPRPGVPPTPKHVQELTALMKSQNVKLMIIEPYFDPKLPRQIAKNAGVAVVVLPPSVGATPEAKDYFSLFDAQLDLIQKALAGGGRS
jgi:zinc/manganese transport system substrate-binding protein